MDLNSKTYSKLIGMSYSDINFKEYRKIVDAIGSLTKKCDYETSKM